MTLVSAQTSTLNPNAPLFVPAAVREVEDFSPEWWDLVTSSPWFHDYWLSQQQGEDGFFGNTQDDFDFLPDSIFADEDTLTMESEYEQFLILSELESKNTCVPSSFMKNPTNGLELELKPMRERGPKSPVGMARYWEKPAKPVSPKVRTQRIQQPR